jgi:nucleoid-associated protein EbfC
MHSKPDWWKYAPRARSNEVAELDFGALMKQAQALQEKLKAVQEHAAAQVVNADSGGGMVRVSVDGSMQVRRIEIDPALIASNDKAMLEDLIVVAVNQGLKRAQEMVAQEMGKLGPLGGLKLPGFGND